MFRQSVETIDCIVKEYEDKEITSSFYGPIVKNAIFYLFKHEQLVELIKKAIFLRDDETDKDQLNSEAENSSLSEQEELLLFALTDKAKAKNSDLSHEIRKQILKASHESRLLYKDELALRVEQHWTRQAELEAKQAEHLEKEMELISQQDEAQLAEKLFNPIIRNDAFKLLSDLLKTIQTKDWDKLRKQHQAEEEMLANQLYVEEHIDCLDPTDFDLAKEPDRIGNSELKSNSI